MTSTKTDHSEMTGLSRETTNVLWTSKQKEYALFKDISTVIFYARKKWGNIFKIFKQENVS